jgi:hypothetical protein
MSFAHEIAIAVRIHIGWRDKLTALIESGDLDLNAGLVGKDNACEFRRWLYGSSISLRMHCDPHFLKVHRLHREFHACAGAIVQLILEGRKQEAQALMEDDGDYTKISDQLVAAMLSWQKELSAGRS